MFTIKWMIVEIYNLIGVVSMRLNLEQLNKLPQEIIDDVKSTLKAYDEVHIIIENGKHIVSCGTMLKAQYADDFEVIGDVYAKDIFNDNERIVNYIEGFHSYPIEYKGERDWLMIKKLEELRHDGKIGIIELVGGNATIKEIVDMKW